MLVVLAIGVIVLLLQANSYRSVSFAEDEYTFILMAQEVADGWLPYTRIYDNKPPLLFAMLGAVLYVFEKSLLAVRVFGDLSLILAIATGVFFARRYVGNWAALAGGVAAAAFCAPDYAQATLSEYPAAAFIGIACLVLTKPNVTMGHCALAGFMMALAVLTRTNLAIAMLLVGLLMMVAPYLRFCIPRWGFVAFGIAGLVPPAVMVMIYAWFGQADVLVPALIGVPLAYAKDDSLLTDLYYLAITFARFGWQNIGFMGPVCALVAIGVWRAWVIGRAGARWFAWELLLPAVTVAGIVLSIVMSGEPYLHYWLQLLPFIALLVGLALGWMGTLKLGRPVAVLASGLMALAAFSLHAQSTADLVHNPDFSFQSDPMLQAARHLEATVAPDENIYVLYQHLVLWYLDRPPLSPIGTHPSNLVRPSVTQVMAQSGYVGPGELQRILDMPPDIIVTGSLVLDGWLMHWFRTSVTNSEAWFETNYTLDADFGDVKVFRKNTEGDVDTQAIVRIE